MNSCSLAREEYLASFCSGPVGSYFRHGLLDDESSQKIAINYEKKRATYYKVIWLTSFMAALDSGKKVSMFPSGFYFIISHTVGEFSIGKLASSQTVFHNDGHNISCETLLFSNLACCSWRTVPTVFPPLKSGQFFLSWLIHCGRSNQCEFWVRSQKHTHVYPALSGCSFLELCIHAVRKLEQPMKRFPRRGTRVPDLHPVWAFSQQPHQPCE